MNAAATEFDPVHRPKHYATHPSGVEAIEITEHLSFCLGNALRLLWRATGHNEGVGAVDEPEEWRFLTVDPRYEVSSYGRIRRGDRIRKTNPTKHGYPAFVVSTSDGARLYYVHHLVAEAFLGSRPKGLQVAHNDGNKSNNHRWNLRYATPKENAADRKRHGTWNDGSQNGQAKLTDEQVEAIREQFKTKSPSELAAEFGVSRSTIDRITKGQAWEQTYLRTPAEDREKAIWYLKREAHRLARVGDAILPSVAVSLARRAAAHEDPSSALAVVLVHLASGLVRSDDLTRAAGLVAQRGPRG